MPKKLEPPPIRQSVDGKWEVKDPYDGSWIKCETKKDAEILSNAPSNEVLFHYCSMITSERIQNTLKILEEQKLHFTTHNKLNDPFEWQFNVSFDAPLDVKNKKAIEYLMKENPQITQSEAKRLAPERWKQIEDGGQDRLRKKILENYGIVCFSTTKDDILMWSHYAGGHTGICIEFRCGNEVEDNDFMKHADFLAKALPVRYEEKVPTVNFYTTGKIEIAKAAILTKSKKHWVYEKEFRIIETNIRCRPHILVPVGAITAIYLGCRIEKNRDAILDCVKKNNLQNKIGLFEAKCKPDVYGLYFEPISI